MKIASVARTVARSARRRLRRRPWARFTPFERQAKKCGTGSWLAPLGGLLLSCVAAAPPSPRPALAALTTALRRGDVSALQELVSDKDRAQLGAQRLESLLRQLQPEFARLGDALATAPEPQLRAWLPYRRGERVPLVWEGGAYRLRQWRARTPGADTPVRALIALAQSLESSQPLASSAPLAQSLRVQLQEGVQQWLLDLRNPKTVALAADGQSALAVLRGGHQVRLVQKAGLWWVSGID